MGIIKQKLLKQRVWEELGFVQCIRDCFQWDSIINCYDLLINGKLAKVDIPCKFKQFMLTFIFRRGVLEHHLRISCNNWNSDRFATLFCNKLHMNSSLIVFASARCTISSLKACFNSFAHFSIFSHTCTLASVELFT